MLVLLVLIPFTTRASMDMSVGGGMSGVEGAEEVLMRLKDAGEYASRNSATTKDMLINPRNELSIIYIANPVELDSDGEVKESLEGVIEDRKIIDGASCTEKCLCVGRKFKYDSDRIVSLVGCERLSALGTVEFEFVGATDSNKNACKSLQMGYKWALPACVDIPNVAGKTYMVNNYTVEITNNNGNVNYKFDWRLKEYEDS